MALTGAKQRWQLEHVQRLVADRRKFLGERFLPDTETTLRQAVRFLVLAACAHRPQEAGTWADGRGEGTSGDRLDPAIVVSFAPAMDRVEGDGVGSGSLPETGTAEAPDAAPLVDPFPAQADLFGSVDTGPPARDLLEDVADELNRDGGP